MSNFKRSSWSNDDFADEYTENADNYLLERRKMFDIMKSFFQYFLKDTQKNKILKILDLGSGNGALSQELLKIDDKLECTLVDGSNKMLENAKKRLEIYKNIKYIHCTFQDLLKQEIFTTKFNFVVSSFAIHHLSMKEKEALFYKIYDYLEYDGYFMNIDVVLSPDESLENWYLDLWKNWIIEREIKLESKTTFKHIPQQYKDIPDNLPNTLQDQLNSLSSIGFTNVDCYYKYGLFSIFGGKKEKKILLS